MEFAEIKVSYSSKGTDKINNSKEIYDLVISHWNKNTIEMQEEVKVVLLNRGNYVLGIYELSKGGLSGTIIDVKLVMSVALKCLASCIVIVHNHPSGNLKPSEADFRITKKIKEACNYFEISLLDHLIITKNGFYSFNDEGDL